MPLRAPSLLRNKNPNEPDADRPSSPTELLHGRAGRTLRSVDPLPPSSTSRLVRVTEAPRLDEDLRNKGERGGTSGNGEVQAVGNSVDPVMSW